MQDRPSLAKKRRSPTMLAPQTSSWMSWILKIARITARWLRSRYSREESCLGQGPLLVTCPHSSELMGQTSSLTLSGELSAYTYRQGTVSRMKLKLTRKATKANETARNSKDSNVVVQVSTQGCARIPMVPKSFDVVKLRKRAERHRGFIKRQAKELTLAALNASGSDSR